MLKTEASLEGFLACWNLLEIQGIIAPVPTSIWRDNVVGKWIFHVPSFRRQDLPLELRAIASHGIYESRSPFQSRE